MARSAMTEPRVVSVPDERVRYLQVRRSSAEPLAPIDVGLISKPESSGASASGLSAVSCLSATKYANMLYMKVNPNTEGAQMSNYLFVTTRTGKKVHAQLAGSSVTNCGHWQKVAGSYMAVEFDAINSDGRVLCERCFPEGAPADYTKPAAKDYTDLVDLTMEELREQRREIPQPVFFAAKRIIEWNRDMPSCAVNAGEHRDMQILKTERRI